MRQLECDGECIETKTMENVRNTKRDRLIAGVSETFETRETKERRSMTRKTQLRARQCSSSIEMLCSETEKKCDSDMQTPRLYVQGMMEH